MRRSKKITAGFLALALTASCLVTGCGSKKTTTTSNNNNTTTDANQGAKEIAAVSIPGAEDVQGQPKQYENKADAKKINLKVSGPAEEQDLLKSLCTVFDGNHSELDINFTYEIIGEDVAAQKIKEDPAKSPDVFMMAGDQISDMVKNKKLYNLDQLKKEDANFESAYSDNAMSTCKVDDTLYALPFTTNQWFMYYNKSLYTEDEVKSLDKMLAKNLGDGVKNFSVELKNAWYLASFFYAGGCNLYGADGKDETACDWNTDKGIGVVKYLNDMVASGKFHNNNESDGVELLKNGKLAALCSGTWDAKVIKESLGDNYAATVVPSMMVNGQESPIKPFADYKVIGVNAVTKEAQTAAYLAKFLAGEYAQEVRTKVRAYAPVIKSLVDKDYSNLDVAVVAAMKQDANTVTRPTAKNFSEKYWNNSPVVGQKIVEQDAEVTGDPKNLLDTVAQNLTK